MLQTESRQKEQIRKLHKSFKHAYSGLRYSLKYERNFQVELVIAACVIALIFIFDVKNWEAILLILMIMLVLTLELVNTALERIVDMIKPGVHPYARLVKDMMAAVVLITSLVAMAVGIIIFYPYVRNLFSL